LSSKNYEIGRRFEYRVQNYLRKVGYYVIRSYASKGVYDLIAVPSTITPGQHYFSYQLLGTLGIQCKTNGYLPPSERKRFKEVIKKWAMCSVLAYKDNKRKLLFKDLKTQEILAI